MRVIFTHEFCHNHNFSRTGGMLQILKGNVNTYTENQQQLNPPIIASKVRFIPYSLHIRTVCMRVEVYGCNFTDGIVHYEAPQGYYKANPELDFRDASYDGEEDESGTLRSGLGILTDMIYGSVDFIRNHKGWIGWERRDNESTLVEIGFQFDYLRKFESVSIHVNNFVSQGAQVFSSVKIHFSLDGKTFSPHTVSFCPKKDLKNDTVILVQIPLFGRLGRSIRMEYAYSNEWLLLSEIRFRSDIFTGDLKSVDKMKSNWNGTGYAPSTTYHHECPEHNQKNKLVTAEQSTAAMIGLIVGCVFVCLLLSGVSVACFVMRKNRRNTKLVGVIEMTPKSMSHVHALGLSGYPSNDQLSTATNVTKPLNKRPSAGGGGGSSVTLNGGNKLGKIALCDMNPVSGDSDDESLYHELVFGRNGPSVMGKSGGGGGVMTNNRKNSSCSGGLVSYNTSLAVANNGSSVGSSCTSTTKTESDSGYGSSSQQLVRKHCGLGTRKTKYQKVNHGADFTDVMALRGMEEEMTYYHTHNQNLGQFQPSSPSTPSAGLRSSKLPLLGQSLGSIPFSSMSQSVHGPPSSPQTFHIPFNMSQHPHPPPIQFSSNHNPIISHNNSHLNTLGNKSMSSIIHGSNNNGYMNTMGSRERSTNGFFNNSPRVNNRRTSSNNNNNQHNHPSAGVNTISAALSAHNNVNGGGGAGGGGTLMTLNAGSSSGNSNVNTQLLLPSSNSFGVSLMKSSGLSTNPASNNHHHLVGPLGICGGESNYYAATDIFQVPDKHFDRF
ncbi:probable serine/threonine-protein kinase DDB_G0282963 isoform X3 [Folsomia candida]|uniref:probable serine/threonine-protein kinase DDB_G0282963 isoform X3 n=1 Tax=Folsomia candida TaxID=158441 RepID=UPI0016054C31|nr:probable serine/threonine-protein kinase DDB_G0282963 isoform X3 [Folsomia candida]